MAILKNLPGSYEDPGIIINVTKATIKTIHIKTDGTVVKEPDSIVYGLSSPLESFDTNDISNGVWRDMKRRFSSFFGSTEKIPFSVYKSITSDNDGKYVFAKNLLIVQTNLTEKTIEEDLDQFFDSALGRLFSMRDESSYSTKLGLHNIKYDFSFAKKIYDLTITESIKEREEK